MWTVNHADAQIAAHTNLPIHFLQGAHHTDAFAMLELPDSASQEVCLECHVSWKTAHCLDRLLHRRSKDSTKRCPWNTIRIGTWLILPGFCGILPSQTCNRSCCYAARSNFIFMGLSWWLPNLGQEPGWCRCCNWTISKDRCVASKIHKLKWSCMKRQDQRCLHCHQG